MRLFLVVSGLVVFFLSPGAVAYHNDDPTYDYKPTGDALLCNDLPSTFGGPTVLKGPCAPDDRSAALTGHPAVTFKFLLPAGHISQTPESFVMTLSSDFNFELGSSIPIGTAVAGLGLTNTFGLATGPCWTFASGFLWEVILWNATTDNSAGNVFNVSPEGTADRFLTLANENPNNPLDPTGQDSDAFSGKADPEANIVTRYPDTSNRLFDPDGSGDASGGYSPLAPRARYAGLTQLPAGHERHLFQVFVFEPAALQSAFAANPSNSTHPFSRLDSGLGWTLIYVVGDPTASVAAPSPFSDSCSDASIDLAMLGRVDANGDTTPETDNITAPTSVAGIDGQGTHLALTYTMSHRDKDGDGLENPIDTCPYADNLDDPYLTSGSDDDALDPVCDPSPTADTQTDPNNTEDGDDLPDQGPPFQCADDINNDGDSVIDELDPDCWDPGLSGDFDGDGFLNSQDYCPLTANGGAEQRDNEVSLGYSTAAPDGGPKADHIGDACDVDDNKADGAFFYSMITGGLCVRNDHSTADGNNDGFCDAGGQTAASQDADGDSLANGDEVRSDPLRDNADGDAYPDSTDGCPHTPTNWGTPFGDGDCDGFTDADEGLIGTDPADPCPDNTADDAWPADFDRSKVINISDVFFVLPPTFGTSVPPASARRDLVPDGVINISDVFKVLPPYFGSSCS